jgi:protein SCO1/2
MKPATRTLALGALALASAAAGVGASLWLTGAERAQVTAATVLDAPRPLPEFALVDEQGAAATREDLAGRWTLLFLGFTHCPDVCPMTLQVLGAAQRELGDLAPERRPAVRFVTVDPERDTPARLADYLASFPGEIRGLTGEKAAITALAGAIGAAAVRVPARDGSDYAMDHTAAIFLLDPQARITAVFTPPHDARTLAADVRAISGAAR